MVGARETPAHRNRLVIKLQHPGSTQPVQSDTLHDITPDKDLIVFVLGEKNVLMILLNWFKVRAETHLGLDLGL